MWTCGGISGKMTCPRKARLVTRNNEDVTLTASTIIVRCRCSIAYRTVAQRFVFVEKKKIKNFDNFAMIF